ncbi:MAG: alpha/beta fold hydrolase [Actinomycetota bacterium]
MRIRTVRVGEVELSVAEAGEGGRPFLLLHGFTGSKEDFTWDDEPVLDRLAGRGFHAVAPDHRGHGQSSKPDREAAYSVEIFAADALGLVDELGWDRFALLGHSMGGVIAQVLIGTAPERVSALVLMDTSHAALEGVDPAMARLAGEIATTRGMKFLNQRQKERGGVLDTPASRRLKESLPGYAEFEDSKLEASSPAMYAAMVRAIAGVDGIHDRLASLASVSVPTLVLVGEQDRPFIGPSERMAKTIPGARMVTIPGAGHSPQFEAPEPWWDALTIFLEEAA